MDAAARREDRTLNLFPVPALRVGELKRFLPERRGGEFRKRRKELRKSRAPNLPDPRPDERRVCPTAAARAGPDRDVEPIRLRQTG